MNWQPIELEQNKWIAVVDRLPASEGNYILFRPDANNEPAFDDNIVIRWYSPVLGFSGIHNVTHWMPLHAPPEKEDSE